MFSLLHPFPYFVLYMILLFIRPQEYPGVSLAFPLMPVTLSIAAALALVVGRDRLLQPALIFLIGLLIAIPASIATNGWMGGAVDALLEFIPTAMLFMVAALAIDSLQKLRAALLVMLSLTVFLSLHSIDQVVEGVGWSGATTIADRVRYIGILGDPNDLANVTLFTVPIALYFSGKRFPLIVRIVALAALVLLMWGIYLTNSRGAAVATGMMLLGYIVLRRGSIKSLLASLAIGLVLLQAAPSRLVSSSESDDESSEGRLEAWYQGLQLLRDDPVFGAGYGMFMNHHSITAHNSFVLAFSELGMFGYYFWFSLVVLCFVMMLRVMGCEQDLKSAGLVVSAEAAEAAALSRTLFFSFTGLITSAFFLSRAYVPSLYLCFGLVVAAFYVCRRLDPSVAPLHFSDVWLRFAGAMVLSLFAFWVMLRVALLRFAG